MLNNIEIFNMPRNDQKKFPKDNEDRPYLGKISGMKIRPIFIIGLHRSGTTFIYESIAKTFPLANLDLYHIFFYQRLLKNFLEGREETDRQRLQELFKRKNITTRNIDEVRVTDTMVEEYGWLLHSQNRSFHTNKGNAPFLREICQKLQFLHPETSAVLLKNPWDTGYVKELLEYFPEARFIFIKRDPLPVLDSFIKATLTLLTGAQPFKEMLFLNSRTLFVADYLVRLSKTIAPSRTFLRIFRSILSNMVIKDIERYNHSKASIPLNTMVELTYETFIIDPSRYLEEISSFLDYSFKISPNKIVARPRKKNRKETLARYESRFLLKLDKRISAELEKIS